MKPIIKTLVLTSNFTNTGSFDANINIDFPVDKIILKGVAWSDGTSADDFAILSSSLFGYQTIVAFPTLTASTYNQTEIVFIPNGPAQENIRGSYSFTLRDINDNVADLTGRIGIVLEFIGKE